MSENRITEKVEDVLRDPMIPKAIKKEIRTSSLTGKKAIENGFPFATISTIAEAESWRKEVYRPIYHLHKWWAQRLGSVFRSIILAAAFPENSPIEELFYRKNDLHGLLVFDPFMGSGTTIGEAVKLGCTAVGRDINPVAYNSVRATFSRVTTPEVRDCFSALEETVGKDIQSSYQLADGSETLYYFWVKQVDCPSCSDPVELFNNYIFARHAYPSRHPDSQCLCPSCNEVFSCLYDSTYERCPSCGELFNPQTGISTRTKATCSGCHTKFPIIQAVKAVGQPPAHRMYAKMVLRPDGVKEYRRITEEDVQAFNAARKQLSKEPLLIHPIEIQPGYNTNQALNYSYTRWDQFFNERQLLSLSRLGYAIKDIDNADLRFIFGILFSGTLEFNNMFCSFKGEGTGAVRHMFSHHILKPERQPLEANLWGTPKSSGSFSTLFKSRLLRALDYKQAPFEVEPQISEGKISGSKRYDCNEPIPAKLHLPKTAKGLKPKSVYLSCGDSSNTDLQDRSVDLVVTDPPFFDNVHYSELADFFYAWQLPLFHNREPETVTTRNPKEVQDSSAKEFSDKLGNVFKECHRVLKDEGILAFTYHHSREEGWSSVAHAVRSAGFSFVFAQPVKAEMSVATPKRQAKEPIDLDIILVCRKEKQVEEKKLPTDKAFDAALKKAIEQVADFWQSRRRLSRNDLRIVMLSHLLVALDAGRTEQRLLEDFAMLAPRFGGHIETEFEKQQLELL